MNAFTGKTNLLSTIVTIYVPLFFVILNISELFSMFGNSILLIVTLIAFFILQTVCNLGSLVQGFQAIGNGKAGTYRSAALFQIILYIIESVMSVAILIHNRNSSNSFSLTVNKVFLVIFIIMLILAFVRMAILKNKDREKAILASEPGLALKLVLFFIVLPIIYIVAVVVLYRLVESNETLKRVLTIIMVVIYILFMLACGIGLLFLLVKGFSGMDFGGDDSDPKPKSQNTQKKKDDKKPSRKDVEKLENRYKTEFKRITGSSPDMLDWKTIKDGNKQEAVKKLRSRMKDEARKNGLEGQSRYF
ncbi:MAG: hypothetical protein IJ336_03070 [Lachnospiraceae bacterium]|nr:hypothetical protein [Lachnospiraceae bacterium]